MKNSACSIVVFFIVMLIGCADSQNDQRIKRFQLKCTYDHTMTKDSLEIVRRAVHDFAVISGPLAREYVSDIDSIYVHFIPALDDYLCGEDICAVLEIEIIISSKPQEIPNSFYCIGHHLFYHVNSKGISVAKKCAMNIFGTGEEIKNTIYGYGFYKTDRFNYL